MSGKIKVLICRGHELANALYICNGGWIVIISDDAFA